MNVLFARRLARKVINCSRRSERWVSNNVLKAENISGSAVEVKRRAPGLRCALNVGYYGEKAKLDSNLVRATATVS